MIMNLPALVQRFTLGSDIHRVRNVVTFTYLARAGPDPYFAPRSTTVRRAQLDDRKLHVPIIHFACTETIMNNNTDCYVLDIEYSKIITFDNFDHIL